MGPPTSGSGRHRSAALSAAVRQAARLHGEGRLREAEIHLRQALAAMPQAGELHLALAALLHDEGRLDEAAAAYRAALAGAPALEAARAGLNALRHEQAAAALRAGDWAAAAEICRALIHDEPDDLAARVNLALALQHLGAWQAARSELEHVLAREPSHPGAHVNLGAVLQQQGEFRLAVAHYQAALARDPGNAAACRNLATVRKLGGQVDQAIAYYRHAQARGAAVDEHLAGMELRRLLHLPAIYQSAAEIEQVRRRLQEGLARLEARPLVLENPLESVGVTAFFLAYHGHGDAALQARIARLFARAYRPAPLPRRPRPPGARLRIGLVSSYFNNHTIGKLNLGTVRELDRRRFAVQVFSIGHHDDRTARAFRAAADVYAALPRDLERIREAIARAGPDVLLFTDIGMDPVTYFLAFSRLAPVQCVTWGHPITTGIGTLDYFLVPRDGETEDGQRHYTESLVRLPTMQPYYYFPRVAGCPKDRVALGLPEDRTLYLCPQSLFKFHPDFDAMLGGILRGDPRGLLVLVEGQDRAWGELLRARWRNTLPDVVERITWLPRMSGSDFLDLIAAADVMLDTPVFCGGNTTYEGLAMGTPIVTLPSTLLRGRLSHAIYGKMDYRACVADGPEQYVEIALRLGRDGDFRHSVREAIRERRPVLYEDPRPVRELEAFFEEAVAGGPARTTSRRHA